MFDPPTSPAYESDAAARPQRSASPSESIDRVREERDTLRAIIESMGDGLCVVDREGNLQFVNAAAHQLLRVPEGESLVGKNLVDIVAGFWPPDKERRQAFRGMRAGIAKGEELRYDDARFHDLYKRCFPVSFSLRPIKVGESNSGAVLVFRDTSERRRAEQALRESEARFRAIFRNAPVAIVRFEPSGRIIEHNAAFEHMLGRASDQLVGAHVTDLMPPADAQAMNHVFAQLQSGACDDSTAERRFVGEHGRAVVALASVCLVRNEQGEPQFAIGVFEDLSELKQLEVTLRHAQKLEAVGRLASGIAHELNTPIQFIGDNTSFLEGAFADLVKLLEAYRTVATAAGSEELAEHMRRVEEDADAEYVLSEIPTAIAQTLDGVRRVATIVQAMKSFAHHDRGERSLADLNAALSSTITVARNELKYVADVELDLGELPQVDCYLSDINQVFLNLLVNAAHAVADKVEGTGTRGTIRVETRHAGDHVVVSIADTGTGIPEEIGTKVFEPFFTTKEVGRGTGQGLALARNIIVDKHGGSIDFDTTLGVGTTFHLSIPVAAPAGRQP